MSATSGRIGRFAPKALYLGLNLGDTNVEVPSLQFEIVYPAGLSVLGVLSYIPGADLVQISDRGVRVTWPQCIRGTQLLFRVDTLVFGGIRDAVVQLQKVGLRACTDPAAPPWSILGGCYVLNPSGAPTACSVAVQPSTWGGVKGLFNATVSR